MCICVWERQKKKEIIFFTHWGNLAAFFLFQNPSLPGFVIMASLQMSRLESCFCHPDEFVLRFWENVFVEKVCKTTSKSAEMHRMSPLNVWWVLIILQCLTVAPQSLNWGRSKIACSTGQSCCERYLHWLEVLFVVQEHRILLALPSTGACSSQQCSSSAPCGKQAQ